MEENTQKRVWILGLISFALLAGLIWCVVTRDDGRGGPPSFSRVRFFNGSGKPIKVRLYYGKTPPADADLDNPAKWQETVDAGEAKAAPTSGWHDVAAGAFVKNLSFDTGFQPIQGVAAVVQFLKSDGTNDGTPVTKGFRVDTVANPATEAFEKFFVFVGEGKVIHYEAFYGAGEWGNKSKP